MSLDDLFAATRSGDPRALKVLLDALYPWLGRFFRRHCNHDADVDDMVQSTFEAILPVLNGFVPAHPRAFEYLAYYTARGILKTKRRSLVREGRWRADLPPAGLAPTTSPSVRVMRRDLYELAVEKAETLRSAAQRTIRDWLASIDWHVQVEREGVVRGALRVRLSRALADLRELVRRADPALFPETTP